MHTKDMLAEALRGAGLADMAERAASGHYHDYLSPLDLPELTLMQELADAARTTPERREAILSVRRRAMNGEFDASKEESDAWAASPEGQDAFRRLMGGS